MVGVAAVALIHAVVFYALLNGLGTQIISVIKALPIEARLIEEIKPPPPPPPEIPPSPPKLVTPPKAFIPLPEVQVQQPPAPNAIQDVTDVQPPPQEMHVQQATNTAPSTGPSVVHAVVDFSTCEKPEYPLNALRNEEKGTVRLQFLIASDGQVADSKIEKSSGTRSLDMAAKKALSLCKFKAGTIDGVPQQSWTAVDYVWKLPD
ncbi:MAG: energy transducer TonB [Solimicrobium sp.]|nr:energy transducer TonB [Solimicrobium sp.]